MIEAAADCLRITVPMTLANATVLREQGDALLGKELPFDFTAVTEVDSSALAVIFAWQRNAQSQGKTIRLSGLPANLLSLASLYGVDDLLPAA